MGSPANEGIAVQQRYRPVRGGRTSSRRPVSGVREGAGAHVLSVCRAHVEVRDVPGGLSELGGKAPGTP